MLGHVHARVLPPPELLVAMAHLKFDAQRRLKDETTRNLLTTLPERFARWILRERAAAATEQAAAAAVPPNPVVR